MIERFRPTTNNISIAAGTELFREGERRAVIYLVVAGTVDLFVRGQRIASIGAGGIVGELSMLMKQPRSATAIARTDCMLAPIDTRQFALLVQQSPRFANQMLDMLADKH